ncbi:AAA family ATPase [Chamaesiphon minutus]|uniref:ATP-dependent Zn protease n=1 Tax=Chamaesiphon minutus (strain ATCC 27169 / PCC 6605) TaxID=1173020 RepID=K9U9V3_CHAP6|nr:AAA family ATPase [Chamaesiphon minutus]AFY91383.1 ATP-dependent Zn protease [Chamaesiphon minutus PCC 6605]
MGYDNFNQSNNAQSKGLLASGWRPLNRDLDIGFFANIVINDTWSLAKRSADFVSDVADALSRKQYSWWANILNVFSDSVQYEFNELWNFITPDPASPDRRHKDVLVAQTPIVQLVSRDSIPIDYVLNRLEEITVKNILEILGTPDLITQYYWERYFYFPPERFTTWERLEVLGYVSAYWKEYDIWVQVETFEKGKRQYTISAPDLAPLINKATFDVAVILSGYKSRVGKINSEYPIRSFPAEIQSFTDRVQQAILSEQQVAVLINGEPGTGKTVWTQAIAKEVLMPLGYVIFILDHDAVENFVPPSYLARICLIINEADNLAKNRALESAQENSKTEHILGLLDGTLYQSVIDESGIHLQQKLVVLMTCNTTDRMDPALLRKGRVDFTYEFVHKFV